MDRGKYGKFTRMTINGKEIELTLHEQGWLRKSLDDAILAANRKYTQTATAFEGALSIDGISALLKDLVVPPKLMMIPTPIVPKGEMWRHRGRFYHVYIFNPEDFEEARSQGFVEPTADELWRAITTNFGENSPKHK